VATADSLTGSRGGSPAEDGSIRHVLHVSMPTVAGVPTILLGYVEDQLARGWSVSVACPPSGWLATAAGFAGAKVLEWPAQRSPGPATLAETRRLRRLIESEAPELVHLHGAKAGLAGRLALRRQVPTVFQPHAWPFLAVNGPIRLAAVAWERWAMRWTDTLICVSEDERDAGVRHGVRGPTCVVPNGVDRAVLSTVANTSRSAARLRLGLPDNPIAVCVGRLCKQKGQTNLLAIWGDVVRRVPGAQLVLVGDGPDRAALEAALPMGARLVGERDDVADWLDAASVVVAPSCWEGMALAPLEAMARARSVVATKVGGTTESVPTGAGALVHVGDGPALARELALRLGDVMLADAEGRVGRNHVAAHHDRAAAATAVVSVYATVLARRDPARCYRS
jgi:glycosyltransferase involved in cell wall biosynthesis